MLEARVTATGIGDPEGLETGATAARIDGQRAVDEGHYSRD